VVQLDKVEPGKVEENDPVIAATIRQLGQVAGDEYAEQFMSAVESKIGVERNKVAVASVTAQLTGQNN